MTEENARALSLLLQLLDIAVGVLLAVVGFRVVNGIRHHTKVMTTEASLEAYKALWENMKLASPTRLKKWHVPPPESGPLSLEERKQIYQALVNWYYEDGNGIFLTKSSREIYLAVKQNLVCEDQELDPPDLISVLGLDNPNLSEEERMEIRGKLSLRQLSLLRLRMRADLTLVGIEHYFKGLSPSDIAFLEGKDQNLEEEPWVSQEKLEMETDDLE